MWYSGGSDVARPETAAIGYATSQDGISWVKHPGNPVLEGRGSEWDSPGVLIPSVFQDGDTLRMWYLGGSGPDRSNIGYAVSTDGISWSRRSSPVMLIGSTGEWNSETMLPGPVIKEEGVYKMWFSGGVGGVTFASPNIRTGIGYATSADGISWSIHDDPSTSSAPYQFSDPVLDHGEPGDWDAHEMFTPTVLRTSTGYEMWYSGWRWGGVQHIGYATSEDGLHWTKHAGNPIAKWASFLVYPTVIRDGPVYKMWTSRWIGTSTTIEYATSAAPTFTDDPDEGAQAHKLNQAYPNPFGSRTRIGYELASSTYISIEVLNILGQRIRVLDFGHRAIGLHESFWDGTDDAGRRVARGVYFYRLLASDRQIAGRLIVN